MPTPINSLKKMSSTVQSFLGSKFRPSSLTTVPGTWHTEQSTCTMTRQPEPSVPLTIKEENTSSIWCMGSGREQRSPSTSPISQGATLYNSLPSKKIQVLSGSNLRYYGHYSALDLGKTSSGCRLIELRMLRNQE